MSSDFTTMKIGEIAEIVGGGTPSTKNLDYWNNDIPWITPADLTDYTNIYISKGKRNISQEGLKKSSAKLLPTNSVLFSSRAPIGYIAIASNPLSTNQGFRSLVCNEALVDNVFIYYNLKYNTRRIVQSSSGTTFREISGSALKNIEINIPSLQTQKKIGKILKSLDDKIEVNTSINSALEKLGETLFRHWFVDFEFPNENGEPYRSSGGAMKDSELGEIPKKWKIIELKVISKNIRKITEPNSLNYSRAYIGLEHLPRKSIALNNWGPSDEVSSNKYIFSKKDILFGKLRPYFHKVGVAPIEGICSTDILVIQPSCPEYFGYLLSQVSSEDFVNYTYATSTGTRMPRTNWESMGCYKILLPSKSILEKWNNIMNSIVSTHINNIMESRNLSSIRDILLPRLMSGKIRVPVEGM